MRLLFVADGRSPIALNWIRHWLERGDEVHLVSTFPCQPNLPLTGFHFIPTAFSGMKAARRQPASRRVDSSLWGASALGLRLKLRHWAGPLTLPSAARRLRGILDAVRPDLVHALRIPYEGMLAAQADPFAPLLVSVWGNDFTLHAPSTPLMRYFTRRAMRRADALHADCQRDIRLAAAWGFDPARPGIVLPGNGGIRTDIFHLPDALPREPQVINPRGFRNYVRNDTFFKSIPLVLMRRPETRFVCPNMAGEAQARKWLEDLQVAGVVELLPAQTPLQMAELFRSAQVLVSPSTHDGTPNSLLEGMACGCFPVAGDLDSIREWITPGVNGQLTDPSDPQALAQAILEGLENACLREMSARHNAVLIAERAEYGRCMQLAREFYEQIAS
jgi:glycosyltransferase involved in cell wall biosynthesis